MNYILGKEKFHLLVPSCFFNYSKMVLILLNIAFGALKLELLRLGKVLEKVWNLEN